MNVVRENENFYSVISKMAPEAESNLPGGFVVVLSTEDKVVGVISDSDVRRFTLKFEELSRLRAHQLMRRDFIYLYEDEFKNNYFVRIQSQLVERKINSKLSVQFIPILSEEFKLLKIVHISDILNSWITLDQRIVIIGLGFVGLTLSLSMAENGETIFGVEQNSDTVSELYKYRSPFHEPEINALLKKNINEHLFVYHTLKQLNEVIQSGPRCYIVCVGTPIKNFAFDSSQIESVLIEICDVLSKGDSIILRSTLPIGASRKFCNFITDKTGLQPGVDFYFGYAPERTVEGNAIAECRTIPQIYSGITESCTTHIEAFLSKVSNHKIRCESTEACEMGKLISNAYRDVVFGFSNEVAKVASFYNLDINRLIDDVNSGYERNRIMKPSPGVGGPCLSKDSYILAESQDYSQSIIMSARKFNEEAVIEFGSQINDYVRKTGKNKLLIVGIAFKGTPPTNDTRNSPSMKILSILNSVNCEIRVSDAVISQSDLRNLQVQYFDFDENWRPEVVCILNNHPENFPFFMKVLQASQNNKVSLFDPWYLCSTVYNDPRLDFIKTLSKKFESNE